MAAGCCKGLGAIGTTGTKGAPDDGCILRFAGPAFTTFGQGGAVTQVGACQGNIVKALCTFQSLLFLGFLEGGGYFLQIGTTADVPVMQCSHAGKSGRDDEVQEQEYQ